MTTTRTITIANRSGASYVVEADRPLLDTLIEHGVDLPYGCRYGGCITCAARLVSGRVVQPNGTALNKRQSKAGYILLCVARPRIDCVIEVGVESHGDLYVNPFSVGNGRR